MDTHELAWAAGFFDGEGCTFLCFEATGATARISINQAEAGVQSLHRFHVAVGGLGRVLGPYAPTSGRQQRMYTYTCNRLDRVMTICGMLWPWLGQPKKDQFARALTAAKPMPRRLSDGSKSHCQRGHEYAVTGKTKWNQCRECMRAYDRRRRAHPAA